MMNAVRHTGWASQSGLMTDHSLLSFGLLVTIHYAQRSVCPAHSVAIRGVALGFHHTFLFS